MIEHTKLRFSGAGLLAGLAVLFAACVGGAGSSPTAPATSSPGASVPPSASTASAPETVEGPPSYSVSPAISTPAPPVPPAQTAAAAGSPVTEADNGRSLTVHVGSEVTLVLHSTYWQISKSSDSAVLGLVSGPTYSAAGTISCIPGTGCGTVTTVFRALTPGQATVTASRSSCGEVLACTGTAGAFHVTFVVEG
jgi:hypothetical protein